MDMISGWLKENSGAILAVVAILGTLLAILGSIFGSAAYIVSELHRVEDELRAIDGRLTASDAQLREESKELRMICVRKSGLEMPNCGRTFAIWRPKWPPATPSSGRKSERVTPNCGWLWKI